MFFFYEFSALSHYKLPVSSLYAPQFLDESFKVQSFIRRDFNFINRYGFGISYKNIGIFWYSLNVEDEFINTFSFGMNIYSVGLNIAFLYPNQVSFGIGFNRTFLNFNICGYTTYGYLKFSYLCAFSEYKNSLFGFEIFLQEGYELEYKFFLNYALNNNSNFYIAFGTNSNSFTIGYKYKFLKLNYFYHSYLGDSFGASVIYEK
ncbi:MAG: hypothetical protein ABIL52_07995 [candidate division WOR-3 bacterium]|jgi:hypothetical protein